MSRRIRLRLADVGAALALLLGVLSASIWARLYYQANSAGFVTLVLLALAFVLAIPLLMPGDRVAHRMGRGLVAGLAALWIGVLFSGGSLAGSRLPVLLLAAGAAGVAGALLLGPSADPWWPRQRDALAVGGLLFFLSAPLIARVAGHDRQLMAPVDTTDRVPTVWLLLDETSFGAAEALARPLRDAGLWTSVHALEPTGRNTLDVVPSIVARRSFGPTTAACSLTAVCARPHVVDFARVRVGREGVDVIGIHHAYCAMQGWRSCLDTRNTPDWAEQFDSLRCAVLRRLLPHIACGADGQPAHDLATRARLIDAMDAARFWADGGDLYAHLPLPHLPASEHPLPSLAVAYELNVARAAELVDRTARRLRQNFPRGFRLVIFSDHPLRPMPACGAAYGDRCERPARYAEPYQVPLIVAAPQAVPLAVPATNAGVLDIFLPSGSAAAHELR